MKQTYLGQGLWISFEHNGFKLNSWDEFNGNKYIEFSFSEALELRKFIKQTEMEQLLRKKPK